MIFAMNLVAASSDPASAATAFFLYPRRSRTASQTKTSASAIPSHRIESVNMSLRKITKTRGSFPTEKAIFKLSQLALNGISQK
jgi:transposase-like protein